MRYFLMVAALLAAPAAGAAGWKAGLASVKITPAEPVRMAGYASRTKPFESVGGDLFAKALVLEDSEGNRSVLITADTLGFPGEMAERICARLRDDGLERRRVLLNASHTHAGPLVVARLGYPVDGAERKAVEAYGASLEDNVVKAVREALANMQPADLSWSSGVVNFVMNRREFTPKEVRLGVNPRGLVDRTVPVLRVAGADGNLRAVVFGAACHCTTLTGQNMLIHGDYAGHAQSLVEAKHSGVQAMFVTGCGGDANPYPRGTLALAKRHGKALAEEVLRVLEGEFRAVSGPLRCEFRRVDLPLQKHTRAEIERMDQDAPSYRKFFTRGALALLDEGKSVPTSYKAPFALWQFGRDLTLVAFSGETLVDYVWLTEKELGPLNLWVAGYSNDLYGYLPTTRVLEEGGYETRGLYMGVGLFAPGVENVVMRTVKEMAAAAGRPPAGR